jgi:hypothetical protein
MSSSSPVESVISSNMDIHMKMGGKNGYKGSFGGKINGYYETFGL